MKPMTEPRPDPLLAGLAAGREAAYAELYERFGARLFRAALGILGSREEAEDAVQDTFTALVRARAGLSGVENLAGYLFAALRRAAADRSARRRAERRAVREVPESPSVKPEAVRNLRLELALAALPEEQREVLALKLDAELTFEEIAAALGVSPNTAASRYRYALEKLRGSLQECRHGTA